MRTCADSRALRAKGTNDAWHERERERERERLSEHFFGFWKVRLDDIARRVVILVLIKFKSENLR